MKRYGFAGVVFCGVLRPLEFRYTDVCRGTAACGPMAEMSPCFGIVIVMGSFSARALALVLEWWRLNRRPLIENWNLMRQAQPFKPIPPLE